MFREVPTMRSSTVYLTQQIDFEKPCAQRATGLTNPSSVPGTYSYYCRCTTYSIYTG